MCPGRYLLGNTRSLCVLLPGLLGTFAFLPRPNQAGSEPATIRGKNAAPPPGSYPGPRPILTFLGS